MQSSLALLSFKGLTVNMTRIKSAEDVARIAIEHYPMTSEDQIRDEAYKFIEYYWDHYVMRRKRARAKAAEKKAARATHSSDTGSSQGSISIASSDLSESVSSQMG